MRVIAAGLMLGGVLFAQTTTPGSLPLEQPKAALGGVLFAQTTTPGSLPLTQPKATFGGVLFAQAPATTKSAPKSGAAKTPAAKPAAKMPAKSAATEWRTECSKVGGFCVQVPQAWKSLGDVFDGAGFVVAEPSTTKPQDDWNQITAAATDMPEGQNGQERPTTEELIDIILGSPSSGIQAQTLQRSRLLVAGMPTDMLKVRLKAKESETDAIEYIALLDDGETIYSVALGCSPDDAARLEPVFDHVLHSWRATPPTGVPNRAPKGDNETPAPPKQ